MRPLPSIRGLAAFDAVARHLSFSRAGRELSVTQGAISHRIRGLEEELDTRLLTRTSRHVGLTEPGRVLFRATQEAFARLRAGLDEMDRARNPRRVTVSCSPSFAIRWLVPNLGDLSRAEPDIDVHVSAEDTLVEPRAGVIDACIRFGPGGYDGVEAERLREERVTPVASPLYLERHAVRRPEDLSRCRLLHDEVLASHADHVGWREWLERAGLDGLEEDEGMHFSHSHLALMAATSGQGVALARRSLVERELEDGHLVAPFSLELPSALTYWLITPKGTPPSPSMARFRAWLFAALSAP